MALGLRRFLAPARPSSPCRFLSRESSPLSLESVEHQDKLRAAHKEAARRSARMRACTIARPSPPVSFILLFYGGHLPDKPHHDERPLMAVGNGILHRHAVLA